MISWLGAGGTTQITAKLAIVLKRIALR